MSFFSRSSGKKCYREQHHGRSYYKREGFFSKLLRMLGSLSNSNSGRCSKKTDNIQKFSSTSFFYN